MAGKAKDWMKFCKHMREAIIDEQKAVPDYGKLIKEAKKLPIDDIMFNHIENTVRVIMSQEKRHKAELIPIFDKVCPRMAVHRKGISGVDFGERLVQEFGKKRK